MSKSHKKRFRAPATFSTPAEKNNSETQKTEKLKAEEPIKLEKVLISDDFYWEVPGDVPASDRRYGMKMVPPGMPNPSASAETSISSPATTKQKEDAGTKSDATSTEAIDTAIQVPSNPEQKVDNITSAPLVSENKANIDTSLQFQKSDTERTEESASKANTEIKPEALASLQSLTDTVNRSENNKTSPINENKAKVAASILPRTNIPGTNTDGTDTTRMETTLKSTPAVEETAKAKSDDFRQQTNSNKKIEPEQVVPSKLKFLEEKNKKGWRPGKAWLILPLLLLLGGVLYEALNNEEESIVANNLEQPAVEQFQPEQVDEIAPAVEEVKTTGASQANPVYYITHVVVKGDTLWDISKKYLNDPFRYPEVAELSNVKNPDLIYPGEIITIATTQPVENGVQAQVSDKNMTANVETGQLKPVRFITHVVVKGDTLWHICKKYLNNPFAYPEVAKLSEIKNPDLIYPGDIVRMQL